MLFVVLLLVLLVLVRAAVHVRVAVCCAAAADAKPKNDATAVLKSLVPDRQRRGKCRNCYNGHDRQARLLDYCVLSE
jgi:hypothetical protein